MLTLLAGLARAQGSGGIEHELVVTLEPDTGSVRVTDQLTLPNDTRETPPFALHRSLEPVVAGGRVEALPSAEPHLRRHRVILDPPARRVTVRYRGTIGTAGQRTMGGMPVATVEAGGVYLDGASAWYPRFEGPIPRFSLTVEAPAGWEVVSQGRRDTAGGRQRWTSDTPQDDIYLIAGPFERYSRSHEAYDLSVYLLGDDPDLATRYLGVMGGYLDLYGDLIGPYPYPKFAVVENRWQTGYGMPSFTLLGSRVLRLPFIPYTSLPHEILHNWWGNGAWVDYDQGNWSEGLTAYLADHLMKELRGEGAGHRQRALERYANFAAAGRDFPLLEFTARHDDASQAVGYSKALMVFHMLRRDLGDDAFRAGLARLWREGRFRTTGFREAVDLLAGAATTTTDYAPWLARTGAPTLALADVRAVPEDGGHRLDFTVRQTQPGDPFPFLLPVAVTLEGAEQAEVRTLAVHRRITRASWRLDARPLRLDLDPAYDVMRLLDPAERAPSLGLLFGAREQWLVVPGAAPDEEMAAWLDLAGFWQRRYGNVVVKRDDGALEPGPHVALWVLGWDNRALADRLERLSGNGHRLGRDGLRVDGEAHSAADRAVVVATARPGRPALGFIGAPAPETVRTLAGKLTHYGSYGRLVFDTDGENLRKDRLRPVDSPLTRHLAEPSSALVLPPREPLAASPFGR